MKTKKNPGYTDYNLNDDRYPKVVCQQHYSTVQERSSAKSPSEYKHKLPDKPPLFNKTQLPHAFTRSTPTGYKDDHTCFLCEQNKGGRPKSRVRSRDVSPNNYPKCLQKTGRGISHPRTKSVKTTVSSLTACINKILLMQAVTLETVVFTYFVHG